MSRNTVVSSRSRKNSISRWILRRCLSGRLPPRQVLMIMGAQRSGTTLLSRIFDDLYYADVYGEFSKLSSEDHYGLRLNKPEQVNTVLESGTGNLVLMKPLVESQRASYWLENIPRSQIVWIYRDFQDVASSSIVKFGEIEGGFSHVRAFVDQEFARRDYATWKSENASAATIEIMASNNSRDIGPYDAAALFWFARNSLFFDQQLDANSDVVLLKYEDFVRHPFLAISFILNRFKIYELRSKTLSAVDVSSVGKGELTPIDANVNELCTDLLQRLDDVFYQSPLGQMLSMVAKGT